MSVQNGPVYDEQHCVNCFARFSTDYEKLTKFTTATFHPGLNNTATEDPVLVPYISEEDVPIFVALGKVFVNEFKINNVTADANELESKMAMCTECSNAFGALYRFYTEFAKLSSQMSFLQQLISATSGWVDRQIYQDLSKKISNELKKEEVIHQPCESTNDIPDLFVSSCNNSENDWMTSNYAQSEDGDDWNDPDYINEFNSEVKGGSSMKTRRMQNKGVTVSIEPLQLDKLECRTIEDEVSNGVKAVRMTYVINTKEQRKKERKILLRRKQDKVQKLKPAKTKGCDQCGKLFKNSNALRKHKLVHSDERNFKCDHCSKTYKEQKKLTYHLHVKHGIGERLPDRTCHICGKYFAIPSMVSSHMKNVHAPEKRFQCEQCGMKVTSQNYLNIHVNMRHKNTSHHCEVCGKTMKSKHALQVHLEMVHLKQKKFSCTLCDKKYYRQDWLREHMRVHEEVRDKPYKCQHCGMAFFSRNCCRNHEKKHSLGKDILCSNCGAAFKNKSSLKRHLESKHTEGQSFMCAQCGKSFKIREYYLQHLRSKSHGGPGHYAERLKEGRTKRVVHKIAPLKEIKSVAQFGINTENEKLASLAEIKSAAKHSIAEKDNEEQEFSADNSYQLVSDAEFSTNLIQTISTKSIQILSQDQGSISVLEFP